MTIQETKEYIARKEQQIEALIKEYGQGVRPGWVSEELAMLTFYKQDAELQLKQMEEDQNGPD